MLCRSALVFLLVALPCRADDPKPVSDEFPAELVRFEPYPKNPVFEAEGPGRWDARIRERGWILREIDGWHMWYTGYDGNRDAVKGLGYARSKDGYTWTRDKRNPLDAENWVEDMMVVKSGDIYYMFAEGKADRAHLLTSKDKVSWARRGQLRILKVDGTPISEGPYGTPTAWLDGETWRLFYERGDKGVWLAKSVSEDLLTWQNIQDEPVLEPGPDEFDRKMIALNQIVRQGDRYYAYYHGTALAHTPAKWAVGVAVSTDLVHWKKYPGNPLRPIEENKSSGILVFDGRQFRLYTMHNQVDVHLPVRSSR